MDFLNKVGKKLSEVGQSAVDKAKELADIAKLRKAISDDEKQVNELLLNIGQKVYEKAEEFKGNEEIAGIVEKISTLKEHVAQLEEDIRTIQNVGKCPNCGAEVKAEDTFCPACGEKLQTAAEETVAETELPTIKCPNCGTELPADAAFCTECGEPIKKEE